MLVLDATTADDAGQLLHPESIDLPALPAADVGLARRWASIPGVTSVTHVRARNNVAYVASSPNPLRIDLDALVYQKLSRPSDAEQVTQDVVAPAGGKRVVVVFAATSGATTIRVSKDDGATWQDATSPGPPSSVESAVPSTLASLPDNGSRWGRTFMTYGGSTLDVSDDGGSSWSRAILGGAAVAQGVAIDTSATTLWCIEEGAIDRVATYSVALSALAVPTPEWEATVLTGWDANGVYSAEADPNDPRALYIGGEGRLGYMRVGDSGADVELKWSVRPDSKPYTYIHAIMPSPDVSQAVVFGGGEQGGGPARVLEIAQAEAAAVDIPLEGSPIGAVRGILRSGSRLFFFVETGSSLEMYAIAR